MAVPVFGQLSDNSGSVVHASMDVIHGPALILYDARVGLHIEFYSAARNLKQIFMNKRNKTETDNNPIHKKVKRLKVPTFIQYNGIQYSKWCTDQH